VREGTHRVGGPGCGLDLGERAGDLAGGDVGEFVLADRREDVANGVAVPLDCAESRVALSRAAPESMLSRAISAPSRRVAARSATTSAAAAFSTTASR
jgi:hypothetical protein